MVTIHREAGLSFVIYQNDHEPAHVHVYGDGNAKIDLGGLGKEPALIANDGFKAGDLRKAMGIVAERQAMLLERWNDYHG